MESQLTRQLTVLLRDWDYRYSGDLLIAWPIKGHCPAEIIGRFSSLFAAADYLCQRCGHEYVEQFNRLQQRCQA